MIFAHTVDLEEENMFYYQAKSLGTQHHLLVGPVLQEKNKKTKKNLIFTFLLNPNCSLLVRHVGARLELNLWHLVMHCTWPETVGKNEKNIEIKN